MKNKRYQELAVCGMAAVKSLAKEHPGRIRRFYYSESSIHEFGELCRYLAQNRVPYNLVEPSELEKLCGSVHHQGVVAMIDEVSPTPLTVSVVDRWVERGESAILLDRIGNANNLGAIVRSAAFFGIRNIIIPLNEAQSAVTTSTYRVAQGGMEYVSLYSIRSAVRLLQDVKGRMVRIGTEVKNGTSVRNLGELCGRKPVMVVFGNEEAGISKVIQENCDNFVIIPATSSFLAVDAAEKSGDVNPCNSFKMDSLNVAQAAAIILYEMANVQVKR